MGHAEGVKQTEMLKHHADAQGSGLFGVADVDSLAVEENITLVWLDGAIDDFHEGGLAGAVFTQDGVGLASFHMKRHAAVGHHP